MSTATNETFDEIRSMLESGHQSVRLEKHSFIIWGVGVSLLIASLEILVRRSGFSQFWQITAIVFLLLAIGISVLAWLDFRLTKRVRRAGDQTISFVQVQLMKLLWVIGLFIVAMNVGLGLKGGGGVMYPVSIGLVGLFFFVSGLFSRQALSWAGLTMIAAAVFCAAFIGAEHWMWVVGAIFGIGLPLLGLLLNLERVHTSILRQIIATMIWGGIVFGAGFVVQEIVLSSVVVPSGKPVALADYLAAPHKYAKGEYIVNIPSGTSVPIRIALKGNIVSEAQETSMSFKTKLPILFILKNSKPDGRLKVGDRHWQDDRTHDTWFWASHFKTQFDAEEGPNASLILNLKY